MTRAWKSLAAATALALVLGSAALSACGGDEGEGLLDLSARPLDLSVVEDLTPPAPECVTDGGCWTCPPKKDVEFLNQCSGSACARYDNSRLPLLLPGGKLPPLP